MAQARILVIEDEPLVSMMAAETLGDAGFVVEEAASGAEALGKLRAAIGSFAGVILDMRLPDRSGDDLARELHAMRPDLPIVIASGYDKGPIQAMFANDPRIAVIAKPYLGNELYEALRSLGVESQTDGAPGSAE